MDKFFTQLRKDSKPDANPPSSGAATSANHDGTSSSAASDSAVGADGPKTLPKGVVLGKDGKPCAFPPATTSSCLTYIATRRCRSCTNVAAWRALAKQQTSIAPNSATPRADAAPSASSAVPGNDAATASSFSPPPDCPPDVDTLGRSTWTLLHTVAASYPTQPNPQQRADVSDFLRLFGRLYPCWVCADDFQAWMRHERPDVRGRSELGQWMCRAHNEVNRKLGKKEFDCRRWEERWREGWKDGRCD